MERENRPSESLFSPPPTAGAGARPEGGRESKAPSPGSRLAVATVQADQRWQASLVRLTGIQDQFRSLRRAQETCLEAVKLQQAGEWQRAERERLFTLRRAQQTQFYRAGAGAALGLLGLVGSKRLASVASQFLELGSAMDLHRLENGVRLLSAVIYLAPTSAFILRARASRELKLTVAALTAGNYLITYDVMSRPTFTGWAAACGWGSALLAPALLLTLCRKEHRTNFHDRVSALTNKWAGVNRLRHLWSPSVGATWPFHSPLKGFGRRRQGRAWH